MAEDNFFLRETFQKRNYLLIYWCLTVFGFIWLLFALIIDQIVTVEIARKTTATFTESANTFWCGWNKITSQEGTPTDYKYSECESETVACATNKTAGEVWTAFNILAILLGYAMVGYGFFYDIRQGGYDVTSIQDWAARLGCTCKFGYTIFGTGLLLFWQLFGLIIYGSVETCSSEDMWKAIFLNNDIDFSSTGGASLALNILSLIFIVLGILEIIAIRIQHGNLPRSQNSPPVAKKETTTTTTTTTAPKVVVKKEAAEPAEKEAPASQAPAVPAEAPNSKLFNPTRTYQDVKTNAPATTKVNTSATIKANASTNVPKTNNNALPNKPSKPPPLPGNKPKGPPPIPSKT